LSIEFDFRDDLLNSKWIKYQIQRELGLKKNSNKILNEFINELKNSPCDLKEHFVKDLLRKIYDEGIEFELQYPLLKYIIFPQLIKDFVGKSMPGIRWLYQIPYVDEACSIQLNELLNSEDTGEEILSLALEINEEDRISQKLLLNHYLSSLEFGIHEVPYGLLNLGIKAEKGYELIEKVNNLIRKFDFGDSLNKEVIYMMDLYQKLFDKWNEFRSQNEIKNFEAYCEKNNFNYLECRAEIWKLGIIHFR
jgi:hypothetical protein